MLEYHNDTTSPNILEFTKCLLDVLLSEYYMYSWKLQCYRYIVYDTLIVASKNIYQWAIVFIIIVPLICRFELRNVDRANEDMMNSRVMFKNDLGISEYRLGNVTINNFGNSREECRKIIRTRMMSYHRI